MKSELEKYSDEIIQDNLGGIFGVKRGNGEGPTVMVAGHMDEVGFMVTSITENGMLRFQTARRLVESSTSCPTSSNHDR